jgi:hypothetical protein
MVYKNYEQRQVVASISLRYKTIHSFVDLCIAQSCFNIEGIVSYEIIVLI